METTKEKIINIARKLFTVKGYGNTSIQDILSESGISKGGFYHYFTGKEDLLCTISQITAREQKDLLVPVVRQPGISAIDKLNKIIRLSHTYKTDKPEIMKAILDVMFSKENLVYRHTIKEAGIEVSTEIFEIIIRQGQNEGVFKPGNPVLLAELIARLGTILGEKIAFFLISEKNRPDREMDDVISIYEIAIERVLGCESGSLNIINRDMIFQFRSVLDRM